MYMVRFSNGMWLSRMNSVTETEPKWGCYYTKAKVFDYYETAERAVKEAREAEPHLRRVTYRIHHAIPVSYELGRAG